MGQVTSFMSGEELAGNTVSLATPNIAPLPVSSSPTAEAQTCMEMEMMLQGPTAANRRHTSDAVTSNDHVNSTEVSVFCLDVSKQSLLQLREILETPMEHRASVFHTISKHSKGVLLTAPGSTSLHTLKSFLLSHSPSEKSRSARVESPSTLHVFALRDPTLVVAGSDGPVVVTREMSTDLLIPLAGSAQLSSLTVDATVLGFASNEGKEDDKESCDFCDPTTAKEVQQTGDLTVAVTVAENERASPLEASRRSRTIVLLYTRDSRFGFDGGDMMLVGCCVAICACIAAAICCCMKSSKNKKAQQQTSSFNNGKPNYNGNSNDYNNYNNNNNNNQYYNNGNSANYYGQPQQPNGNYGNPYAPNQNYNGGSSGAGGYGVPPNAYSNDPNYQNQNYQYQQQQNYGNNGYNGYNGNQPNGVPMLPASSTPAQQPAASPL